MARDFDKIYAEAPKGAVGRLSAFRERYPCLHMDSGGSSYRVWDIDEAQNDEVYVFFPSGIGFGEIWFPYMLELRNKARLIALSYAQDETADALISAFEGLLREMGVPEDKKITIFGMSVGGLAAQAFAARRPERVKSLILAFSGTSAQGLPGDIREKWIKRRKLKMRLRFMAYSPMDRLRMAGDLFEGICPEQYRENQRFWCAYFEDCFDRYVYKAQHIALNASLIPDIYQSCAFSAGDFDAGMRTLILESSGDHTYPESERALLKRIFPAAAVVDVSPNGQFSLQINEAECIEAINDFLKEGGG